MPGESPAVFGDALRRLAGAATYLYQDGPRYWYSTQPTVTKLAEDRAEQLKRDPDKVVQELDERLRADLQRKRRLQPRPPDAAVRRRTCPTTSMRGWSCWASSTPTARKPGTPAEAAAKAILESRGNAPRLYRNTLVVPGGRQDAAAGPDEAVRAVPRLGVDPGREGDARPLDPHQVKQAETQKNSGRRRGDGAAAGDLPVAAGAGAGDAAGRRSTGRRSG